MRDLLQLREYLLLKSVKERLRNLYQSLKDLKLNNFLVINFKNKMGNSFHLAICSGKLPEGQEFTTEIIPNLLSICILHGVLLEYTVGTDGVTGVQLPFDLGDGFTAVSSTEGVVVLGGS